MTEKMKYRTLTATANPFTGAYHVNNYGWSDSDYHRYFLNIYGDTLVENDINNLRHRIAAVFEANAYKYDSYYKTAEGAEDYNPLAGYKSKIVEQASGTDTTAHAGGMTTSSSTTPSGSTETADYVTQYNDDTPHLATKTTTNAVTVTSTGSSTYAPGTADSMTHGKRTERTEESTGRYTQQELIEQQRRISSISLLRTIMEDVLQAVSAGVQYEF